MFNMNKVKVGDIMFSNWEGKDVKIKTIVPYEPSKHGKHKDEDGSNPTHIITMTSGANYSNQGFYIGSILGRGQAPHLEMPGVWKFHPIVRAESEEHELTNLFETDSEAEEFSKSCGFEYVGRGNKVKVPR